jgi:hypothetical protein
MPGRVLGLKEVTNPRFPFVRQTDGDELICDSAVV